MAIPDTGSLRGDLEAMIAAVPDFGEVARRQMGVIIGLATAIGRDAALKTAISENLLERPRSSLRQVLERAVARGEIAAGRDLDLLSDVLIGLNTIRILFGEVPDRAYVRRVFETILYPLAIAPDS